MVYVTGGFAYGEVKNEVAYAAGSAYDYKRDTTATGYVLGGGVEYKFSPAWSVKGEYQLIDLGKVDPVRPDGRTSFELLWNQG